jgi:uncharacterized membrane protein YeaQ/YmgE (transglycosylase-associated protein family)
MTSGGRADKLARAPATPFLGERKRPWDQLIVSLISGGVGGSLAGALPKKFGLGPVGNTIAGLIGGGVGGQILGMLMPPAAGGGGHGMVGDIAGSAVGGGLRMVIVGII